jgi:NADH dehydrogenase FAD-containing subunit
MQRIKGVPAVSHRWRVIIVGGEFGGLRAAQALKAEPVEVPPMDRRHYPVGLKSLCRRANCLHG